jgi:hypothetical protein
MISAEALVITQPMMDELVFIIYRYQHFMRMILVSWLRDIFSRIFFRFFLNLRAPLKNVRLKKYVTRSQPMSHRHRLSRNSAFLISIISYLSHSLNSEMIINNMIFIFDRLSCSIELATSCRVSLWRWRKMCNSAIRGEEIFS